jgi:hypothetical protein
MIHEDDEEYTDGSMFIVNIESNFVKAPIAPTVENEEISLENRGVWKRTVGRIVADGIIHIGDGIVDKIIEPSLRLLG